MGKIISLFSAIQGNGAKYTATHLSRLFQEDQENKILLVDFDFHSPVLAKGLFDENDEEMKGIDALFAVMHHKEIEEEAFQSFLVETDYGVDLLKGTSLVGDTKHVNPEQIVGVLEKGKRLYDYVIVVSSLKENIAAPYILSMADEMILMLRQNHANVSVLSKQLQMIEQFCTKKTSAWALFNYYTEGANNELNDLLGTSIIPFQVLGAIEFDPKSIDNVEVRTNFLSKAVNERAWKSIFEKLQEGE